MFCVEGFVFVTKYVSMCVYVPVDVCVRVCVFVCVCVCVGICMPVCVSVITMLCFAGTLCFPLSFCSLS